MEFRHLGEFVGENRAGGPQGSASQDIVKEFWAAIVALVLGSAALRDFPDESVEWRYPEAYIRCLGDAYQPPDYLRQACERARRQKWDMMSRLIAVNDPYAFDPHTVIGIDDFGAG